MTAGRALLLVALASCGSKDAPKATPGSASGAAPATAPTAKAGSAADECQQFVDKSRPVLEKMAKSNGMPFGDAELATIVGQCRADPRIKGDPVFACVVGASDAAAVDACYQKALGDYAAKSKQLTAPPPPAD